MLHIKLKLGQYAIYTSNKRNPVRGMLADLTSKELLSEFGDAVIAAIYVHPDTPAKHLKPIWEAFNKYADWQLQPGATVGTASIYLGNKAVLDVERKAFRK